MINKQLFILITFCLILFTSCGNNNSAQYFSDNTPSTKDLEEMKNLDIIIEHRPLKEHPLNISVVTANNTDHDIELIYAYNAPPNALHITEDGKHVVYIGPNILYSEDTILLKPDTTTSSTIIISNFYAVTKGTHRYEISLSPLEGWNSNTIEFDATLTKNGTAEYKYMPNRER